MRRVSVAILSVLFIFPATAHAREFYISAKRGRGKKATKSKPAKDIGNIIKKLKPGDTIHVAEGTYFGRGRSGTNVITVPVKVKCGYSDDFTKRDPWGKHQSVLTGDNTSKNWKSTWTLGIDLMKYRDKEMPKVVVDGCIFDNGGRNNYKSDKNYALLRRATPSKGRMPSPDSPALMVRVSKTRNYSAAWDVDVRNNVVVNSASRTPLAVSGYKNSVLDLSNNCVVNSSGGIYFGTKYRPRDGKNIVRGKVHNNTVLFSWLYDSMTSNYSGYGLKCDPDTYMSVKGNVFGVSQYVAVDNTSKCKMALNNNLIFASRQADYIEFNTMMALKDIEDEADLLDDSSGGNVSGTPTIAVSKGFRELMASVVIPNRAKIESKVKAANSGANALRRIFGLPLQAGTVKGPKVPVWLPRMSVSDALRACRSRYQGRYGSKKP
jgi:hypothetical protein